MLQNVNANMYVRVVSCAGCICWQFTLAAPIPFFCPVQEILRGPRQSAAEKEAQKKTCVMRKCDKPRACTSFCAFHFFEEVVWYDYLTDHSPQSLLMKNAMDMFEFFVSLLAGLRWGLVSSGIGMAFSNHSTHGVVRFLRIFYNFLTVIISSIFHDCQVSPLPFTVCFCGSAAARVQNGCRNCCTFEGARQGLSFPWASTTKDIPAVKIHSCERWDWWKDVSRQYFGWGKITISIEFYRFVSWIYLRIQQKLFERVAKDQCQAMVSHGEEPAGQSRRSSDTTKACRGESGVAWFDFETLKDLFIYFIGFIILGGLSEGFWFDHLKRGKFRVEACLAWCQVPSDGLSDGSTHDSDLHRQGPQLTGEEVENSWCRMAVRCCESKPKNFEEDKAPLGRAFLESVLGCLLGYRFGVVTPNQTQITPTVPKVATGEKWVQGPGGRRGAVDVRSSPVGQQSMFLLLIWFYNLYWALHVGAYQNFFVDYSHVWCMQIAILFCFEDAAKARTAYLLLVWLGDVLLGLP